LVNQNRRHLGCTRRNYDRIEWGGLRQADTAVAHDYADILDAQPGQSAVRQRCELGDNLD
jgi:hypothetical protein